MSNFNTQVCPVSCGCEVLWALWSTQTRVTSHAGYSSAVLTAFMKRKEKKGSQISWCSVSYSGNCTKPCSIIRSHCNRAQRHWSSECCREPSISVFFYRHLNYTLQQQTEDTSDLTRQTSGLSNNPRQSSGSVVLETHTQRESLKLNLQRRGSHTRTK